MSGECQKFRMTCDEQIAPGIDFNIVGTRIQADVALRCEFACGDVA